MEEEYYADRVKLRQLQSQHPNWAIQEFMDATNRSRSWVKKWFKRFRAVPPSDEAILRGQSHVPKHLPAHLSEVVAERILDIRDNPPGHLQRVPGPKAIQHYLEADEHLRTNGKPIRPSTRSIWEVLVSHGRIVQAKPVEHEPVERPAPMSAWELDFKDVSSVKGEPEGKRLHALECLNVVDKGTSILVDFRLNGDFNAQTVLEALVSIFRQRGLPQSVTIDRDVRFVGSATARDFPSALIRFLQCVGVEVIVCPPQTPQEKPFVERYNGTYDRECLKKQLPKDQAQAQAATERFMAHYNFERPHQGISCGNQPPRVAFPDCPILPTLPTFVDPDAWLKQVAGRPYVRRINQNGSIKIDHCAYYIKRALAGQYVLVTVDANTGEFVVEHRHQIIKRLSIRGLQRRSLPFEPYVELMLAEALSEWRRYLASHLFTAHIAA